MTTALIVCVGNSLVADDGVGSRVYEALLTEHLPGTIRLERLGVLGIELLDLFDREDDLVLVDAAKWGDVPGTIKVHQTNPLEATHSAVCAHDIGFTEALAIGRLLAPSRLPQRTTLVTVEGACFDELRESLSPDVEAAIPKAVMAVLGLISQPGAAP
jgi:hydrogenase maturation protease